MKTELDGHNFIVTGAGRGIGATIAKHLGLLGSRVFLVDLNEQDLSSTLNELTDCGMNVCGTGIDLRSVDDISRMYSEAFGLMGRIDGVVHNARSGERASFASENSSSWDSCLDVGLKSVFFSSREFIMWNGSRNHKGSIVNIGSVLGELVGGASPAYHAAKGGLQSLTRYLAVEAGKVGIRVNTVSPGFIVKDNHRNEFTSAANSDYRALVTNAIPLGRVGNEQDVANVVGLLLSPLANFVTGTNIVVDGGMSTIEQFATLEKQFTSGSRTIEESLD